MCRRTYRVTDKARPPRRCLDFSPIFDQIPPPFILRKWLEAEHPTGVVTREHQDRCAAKTTGGKGTLASDVSYFLKHWKQSLEVWKQP